MNSSDFVIGQVHYFEKLVYKPHNMLQQWDKEGLSDAHQITIGLHLCVSIFYSEMVLNFVGCLAVLVLRPLDLVGWLFLGLTTL